MNSKRALYKPVTSGKGNTRERRKPLAQGRLVTDHAGGHTTSSNTDNAGLTSTQALHSRHPVSQPEQSVIIRDDPTISPRRETPQISFHDSPRVVKPTQSLDVSDVESDVNFSCNSGNSMKNVMVVNAKTPPPSDVKTNAEVLLEAHFTNSPARVVCHSPGRVYGDLRNTGDVDLASQVTVDKPHKVNIVSEEDGTLSRNEVSHGTDVCTRDRAHVDVVPSVNVSLIDEEDSEHEGVQKDGKSEVECLPDDSTNQHSLEHVRDLDKENHTASPSAHAISGKPRRKKVSHTVESRYMSHFGPVTAKGPMKAVDRNVVSKSSALLAPVSTNGRKASHSQSATANPVRSRKVAPRTERGQRQVKKSGSSAVTLEKGHSSTKSAALTSRLGGTPDMKGYKGSRGGSQHRTASADRKSSTPTAESSALPETADISAIGPPNKLHHSTAFASPSFEGSFDIRSPQSAKKKLGFVSTHHASHPKSAKKGHSLRISNNSSAMTSSLGLSVSSQNTSTEPHSKQSKSHVTQMELELTYARMLQWVYPYASLKYGVKQREKHFMDQVQGIREENENLRQRKYALEVELAQLQHMNALDEALTVQESGLSIVSSSLPEFRHQYHTLAQSLDTTRHQLPTTDILIPDCHQDFQAELSQCLEESERLLGELDLMSRRQVTGVTQCAKSLDLLNTDRQAELSERKRCAELLAAADMLSEREASLQTMQLLTDEGLPCISALQEVNP